MPIQVINLKSYLGWNVDFTAPPGEPGFAAPDSMSWKVFKNPVALAVGGVAAVLLEFADARIRSGVWDHSTFKSDAVGRAQRTGMAAMIGVFGPQSVARRMIQGVTNMHVSVAGKTPSGEAYKAMDVELLDWVAATAGYGFITAYERFVAPVSYEDKCRFFEDSIEVGRLYGVGSPLRRPEDFDAMLDARLPRFEPHPINGEFLAIIKSGAAASYAPKMLHRWLANASVSILPPAVREVLELGPEYELSSRGAGAIKLAGRAAERMPVRGSPPANAAIRLGLPWTFAWKSDEAKRTLLEQKRGSVPVTSG